MRDRKLWTKTRVIVNIAFSLRTWCKWRDKDGVVNYLECGFNVAALQIVVHLLTPTL